MVDMGEAFDRIKSGKTDVECGEFGSTLGSAGMMCNDMEASAMMIGSSCSLPLQRAVSAPESGYADRETSTTTTTTNSSLLHGVGGTSVETYRGLMHLRRIPVIQLTQDEPDIPSTATKE